jgi:general secretion pathway protein D
MEGTVEIQLGRGLDLLLEAVSAGAFAELDYVVEDGVITIATRERLPSELTTLVYDVSDLLGRTAAYFSRPGRGRRGVSGRAEEAVEYFEEEEEEMERDRMEERAEERAVGLVGLIVYTVEPESWYFPDYDLYGEGTITVYENKKLIVQQTRKIHSKVAKLLKDLRKALGHQVAIEARFLSVSENFLEDIGLDIDFSVRLGGKWRHPTIGLLAEPPQPYPGIDFDQGSAAFTIPGGTGVPGSLSDVGRAMAVTGGWGTILDDLQVSFLLKATQARRDATSLTAPKVSVLSGESATLRVQRTIRWADDIDVEMTERGGEFVPRPTWTVNYETRAIPTGAILNISPTITPDKKHVLLNIWAEVQDFLGWRSQAVDLPIFGVEEAAEYSIQLPETEISRVATRVSVPDGATLLLGGQKLAGQIEKVSGVPIISKIPLIGRAFSNRSMIKDEKVLLILVKPTIILQEEAEAEAIAAMEGEF